MIAYNKLSSGIQSVIFRIGHLYSLYFNRNINRGFLLVDEPENSLFPDFLYSLLNLYFTIPQNTQIFMATHSPLVAAQFQPYERFILTFDDEAKVTVQKGVSPAGDDPNDLLHKDFAVRSILGPEGVKQWERYVELKELILRAEDKEIKRQLYKEFSDIGNSYDFPGI